MGVGGPARAVVEGVLEQECGNGQNGPFQIASMETACAGANTA